MVGGHENEMIFTKFGSVMHNRNDFLHECVCCVGDSCLLTLQGEEIYHGRDCRTSSGERGSTCKLLYITVM